MRTQLTIAPNPVLHYSTYPLTLPMGGLPMPCALYDAAVFQQYLSPANLQCPEKKERAYLSCIGMAGELQRGWHS
jgi:hypothetical protein